jgi:hypothetical protein
VKEPDPDWRGKIEQHLFRGAPVLNEVVFFHRATGTLIFTDLVFNVAPKNASKARCFFSAVRPCRQSTRYVCNRKSVNVRFGKPTARNSWRGVPGRWRRYWYSQIASIVIRNSENIDGWICILLVNRGLSNRKGNPIFGELMKINSERREERLLHDWARSLEERPPRIAVVTVGVGAEKRKFVAKRGAYNVGQV